MSPRPRTEAVAWPVDAENRFVLTGSVSRLPLTRFSPAGIPVTRFTVDHRSQQLEAGLPREAVCRLVILAVGEALQGATARLDLNVPVRVSGFITRAGARDEDTRLVLHADSIEILQ